MQLIEFQAEQEIVCHDNFEVQTLEINDVLLDFLLSSCFDSVSKLRKYYEIKNPNNVNEFDTFS